MADDSGAEKPSTHPKAVARLRLIRRLSTSVILMAFIFMGIWLATRIGVWQVLGGESIGTGLFTALLAFVALAFVTIVILWKVPRWQVEHAKDIEPKERFASENEARKTLATILGGIILLSGLFGTFQSLQLTKYAQKSAQLAQEGQLADRFTKAIEQLGAVDSQGSPKLEVRLGGIYALARIANDSERDHWRSWKFSVPIFGYTLRFTRNSCAKRTEC